jgi:cytochrome c oxidase subunit II
VTARQFALQFGYPQAGGKQVLSSILYLPVNRPVVFKIRSLDVVHSFFVPSFSEKIDAVPGIVTTLRVTPNAVGSYPVECTELCGAGHSLMRTGVRVVSVPAFSSWLRSQKPNGPPPVGTPPPNVNQAVPGYDTSSGSGGSPSGSASAGSSTGAGSSSGGGANTSATAGKAVFTGAAGCSGCHTLAAAGASGTVGPNLDTRLKTDCASEASTRIRGATLQQCIKTAIVKPYAYLPNGYSSGIMPADFGQRLTSDQIQALVNFLAGAAK